ncbi:mycofactocin system creatininase family protein [Streptomyces sp. V4I23]|uniref:mycofactocin biosynthesis peptidyl-dipeptidase MftE n=1 Tax=Streptomyces sp. V4I23 TaxID=3042282 RepID=UPI002789F0AD|nr:mycofactocin biosynthesis peptidyl-dipeptidase MftE [Streptomyces sp. V4I23]MDQ1012121.1 mycofactocin system creatininase family protein [Streptomyces sp. V4I23]
MKRLAELTWRDVAVIAARSVLVIPLGATEQHGPHLPFTVDSEVAVALCERLAKARPSVVLAPAVPYGSSGEHARFPGTLSIGQRATELLIVELGRSADAFAGVLFVSGHGGNAVPLRRSVTVLRSEGRRVHAWSPSGPPEDSHAGRTETSALLALRPEAVRLTEAEPGARGALSELMPMLRVGGVAAVSPNGVLGDPAGASRREGLKVLEAWEYELVAAFDRDF